ncbi:MAG: hypothetical protein IJ519_05715, partial [Clostridia bacterium]|nr:hypothetical protein [Clostridia bacterium]
GVLYLAEGGALYAYHVAADSWGVLPLPPVGDVISLTAGESGVYALTGVHKWENYVYLLDGEPDEWSAQFRATDFDLDVDKGPATLTLHATAERGTVIGVTLTEELSGRTLSLGEVTGTGGAIRFRTRIRGGAGHSYRICVRVKGQAVIRGISLTARKGVSDRG